MRPAISYPGQYCAEIQSGRGIDGQDYVHLDITHLGPEVINEKLWEIASFARLYTGIEPTREPIPVQPTCHYMMGGIPTDGDGRVLQDSAGTPLPGLFAAGECACVSVHGANRLGCNSLLDLVVFGARAGKAIRQWLAQAGPCASDISDLRDASREKVSRLLAAAGKEQVPRIRNELQELMMEQCSVFRDAAGLEKARRKIRELQQRFGAIGLSVREQHYNMELVEALECDHLLSLAAVIVESALLRRESRGAHFREDYPERDDRNFLCHTLAFKEKEGMRIEKKPVRITRFEPVARTY